MSVAISIVVPVYRCGECLVELHGRLVQTLEQLDTSFEMVLVNDGCPAGSGDVIAALAAKDWRVKGVHLSRNFGQQSAIAAGIHRSTGDWVVVMDGDLQDQPEEIAPLFKKALAGYDVVFAVRGAREDSFFKKQASRTFYYLYNLLSDIKLDHRVANFSIASRQVVNSYCRLKEHHRAYHLLLRWMGYRSAYVEVRHAARFAGESAYNLRRSILFAIDSITSHSNKPLELSVRGGFLMALVSIVALGVLIYRYFVHGIPVPGWGSMIFSLYFIAGLLFANLGLIGIYLGRVFAESRNRPLYLVSGTQNLAVGEADVLEKEERLGVAPVLEYDIRHR